MVVFWLLVTARRDVVSELEVVSTVEEDEMSDLASLEILQQIENEALLHKSKSKS